MKTNSISQHRPNFIDLDESLKVFEFDHPAELKDCEWVDLFTRHHNFHRLSVDRGPGRPMLMCEQDEGRVWFVVGYFKYDVDLPTWTKPKKEK